MQLEETQSSPEIDEQAKNDLITTDDGLDQAIQRAIAQHDLEQQQLEQNGNLSAENEQIGHELHSEQGQGGYEGAQDTQGHVEPRNDTFNSDLAEHGMDLGGSPLLDAAQEKQHLQMIADELKRAATDPKEAEAKNEGGEYDDSLDLDEESESERGIAHADSFPQQGPETGSGEAHGSDENGSGTPGGAESETGHALAEFPEHGAVLHGPGEHNENSEDTSEGSANAAGAEAEAEEGATGHIPANSELLATNNAIAAYNALLSQTPLMALLTKAHLAALPLPIVPTNLMPARIQLLVSSLAVLDNLATQLLRVFAAGPYQKIIDLALSPETAPGAAFRDLTSLFEFTKRLYSEEDPFLTVEHIAPGIWKEGEKTPSMFQSREQTIELTLRKVNLATFLAATLGTIEVGFFHLNESFLHVFCPANDLDPANSMLNMSASNMNLQSGAGCNIGEKCGKLLKPQASLYLDLKTQAYISAIEAGERLSEEILEDILPTNLEEILQARRGTKVLSPTEMDFIHRCNSRKEILLNYPPGHSLNEEYEWFEFLKDLFDFVAKNMGFLLWGKKGKAAPVRASRNTHQQSPTPHSDEVLQYVPERPREEPVRPGRGPTKGLDDITAALLPSEIQEQQIHLKINPAMSKGPNRRPWTREEEKALRHAMELKGTQWSVILELFGQGGRINESLKNRTQVQLKDKARNWKMFFLKSGLAVPHYLQKVTGDLERDDKLRAKTARNKKTAAAPVPPVAKRDATLGQDNIDEELRKRQRLE